MKNIKIKRFSAYLLDLIIVILITTLLNQINFLNPYKSKYNKVYEKYEEYYKENFNENTTIDYDIFSTKEYLDLTHDLAYYSMSYTIIFIVVSILYFVLFTFIFEGQTVGKKFFKLKIVDNKKNKPSILNLLIRTLFYPIWTNIILYTTLSNFLILICIILFKGKTYFYSNLIISLAFAIYCYVDVISFINKDECIHEKLSKTKIVEINKGV